MIQLSTKQMDWSKLLFPSSSTGLRSSSIGSTTSVGGSKGILQHSVSLLHHKDEDRRPTPKKVDFNRSVLVKRISRRDHYSKEERSNMWYSQEEYTEIRQGAIDTVTKMATNKNVDMDPNDSSRGLEGKTPKQNALRQERRRMIMSSVLNEQLETDLLDDYETSSEAISATYSLCSQSCTYEAERRGALDALEAMSILETQ
jgi:hypothetical protein